VAAIEQTLRTLRDVQGVYGSFVIAANGGLVARDLPEIFDPELLAEVGPRVIRLYETFMSGGDELDACVIRYAEHKLYVRAMAWGSIGILSGVGVNMPALRMVANLVIRKIDPEVQPSPHPATTPVATFDPTVRSFRPPDPTLRGSHGPPASSQPPERTSSPPPERASWPPSEIPVDANGAEPSSRQVRMYRGRPVLDD